VRPPSGHVLGCYARSERELGVQAAPANTPLAWVDDVAVDLEADVLGRLNAAGVDALRALPGRGVRIMGARTAGHDAAFRFVPVRRLVIQVRRAVEQALQWVVFEPNTDLTHLKVSLTLTSYLGALWERGGLAGTRAEEAFVVRCDRTLLTDADRDAGRLVAEIGIAPLVPCEFVLVRVWRVGNELDVGEEPLFTPRAVS
jgi:phage tail sheath protein FI